MCWFDRVVGEDYTAVDRVSDRSFIVELSSRRRS